MIEAIIIVGIIAAPFIFICWRVDKDCRTVEAIWKDAADRMKR